MILKQNFLKFSAVALVASVLGISSCKDEGERLTLQDTAAMFQRGISKW